VASWGNGLGSHPSLHSATIIANVLLIVVSVAWAPRSRLSMLCCTPEPAPEPRSSVNVPGSSGAPRAQNLHRRLVESAEHGREHVEPSVIRCTREHLGEVVCVVVVREQAAIEERRRQRVVRAGRRRHAQRKDDDAFGFCGTRGTLWGRENRM